MYLIDLSHPLHENTPVYPGDQPLILEQRNFLHRDSFVGYHLQAGLHIGTHIDTPMHLLERTETIDCFPADRFCGKATLIDARNKQTIRASDTESAEIPHDSIVLLRTDWSERYHCPDYYTGHPVIHEDFVRLLCNKRVKLLGFDMPSPDRFPFPVHKLLLEEDILLLENLTNLSRLEGASQIYISALPLRIAAEASPVRAVAMVSEEY